METTVMMGYIRDYRWIVRTKENQTEKAIKHEMETGCCTCTMLTVWDGLLDERNEFLRLFC